MKSIVRLILLTLIGTFTRTTVLAQNYSVNWRAIDGGGGTSTGTVYSVSGTLGQPDASRTTMTGGSDSLTGG